MGKSLDEKIKKLGKKRQAKIARRFEELEAEEMTLRDLRKAMDLTQKTVAKKLKINQDNVSRLEARSDVLLSTLQAYVHSLGGKLTLLAEFPDRPPVSLTGFSALEHKKPSKSPRLHDLISFHRKTC